MSETKLNRSISLPMLILYGLGTMIGGGFFALLGEIADEAGLFMPLAFLLSGGLAFISATSFAELSSRFPFSAGEARYTQEGFSSKNFSTLVGWLVILTGIVSAATITVATAGFIQDFIAVSQTLTILFLVLGMGIIAGWGIGKSVAFVAVISVIQIGALVYIVFVGGDSLQALPSRWTELFIPTSSTVWLGVFSGAFLGFYAFIGFEDMVNMAEEVKDVRKNLPIAILVSIVLTTLIYIVVSTIAVLTVSPQMISSSNTPVAEILRGHGDFSMKILGIVSILIINGALAQIIMASRVIYGLSKKDKAPTFLGKINAKTQTPLRATALITLIVLVLSVFFPLKTLAESTSFIILIIFAIVNLSLWRIKGRENRDSKQKIYFPRWISLFGFMTSIVVIAFQVWQRLF
ncbi:MULTISPECIES: APC family permease [unclassified Colwellia]|uniref:APC family permease n=1 Tax=unclassified Colwellia TaxID=196834 RepID=UPI0015F6F2E2|nr:MULTISPECIES: amino acid permease [unclassified Colwellia]MBA6346716.1 amino acid permease [Colwellia sp. BRX8-9]MBA6353537.1 amino acid permease [Colwellia sp. BRX9-1]MBA6357058.1 amino acid permease [Colwellia sp. BRX8-3]MBA6361076.1 amino acid permease [Colwellia sp. BRX8-6]MBA6369061.1 amino acid permease [Colwellia sp. BRX8-5]